MTTTSAAREPGPGSFVDRLPIGKSLPIPDDSLVTRDIFPLEGETRVKPLRSPVLTVPPRERAAGIGPMLQRVESVFVSPGGMTARVHSSKRGEGGERRRTDRRIAAALAADGGKAYAL
ncbi:hypothetical protein AB0P36_01955 [Streptomyces flavidovirens]|uniref:hypothetical protein n=1 Tax=Streptomyces flavidovirens TaxID=67298 RepID=UPI00343A4521